MKPQNVVSNHKKCRSPNSLYKVAYSDLSKSFSKKDPIGRIRSSLCSAQFTELYLNCAEFLFNPSNFNSTKSSSLNKHLDFFFKF